jgi:hypothetical protein
MECSEMPADHPASAFEQTQLIPQRFDRHAPFVKSGFLSARAKARRPRRYVARRPGSSARNPWWASRHRFADTRAEFSIELFPALPADGLQERQTKCPT